MTAEDQIQYIKRVGRMYIFYLIHTVHILIINISTKNTLNKIQFMININLLHVSAPGCNLQGVFRVKELQTHHIILGLPCLYWSDNPKINNLNKYKLTMVLY
jgi:hypothetical protein